MNSRCLWASSVSMALNHWISSALGLTQGTSASPPASCLHVAALVSQLRHHQPGPRSAEATGHPRLCDWEGGELLLWGEALAEGKCQIDWSQKILATAVVKWLNRLQSWPISPKTLSRVEEPGYLMKLTLSEPRFICKIHRSVGMNE